MNIHHLNPNTLTPNPQNPRKLEDAIKPVAQSIKEFGFLQPIVINDDGVILAGHARCQAALSLELDSVPVVKASDLTQDQQNAFMLADNRLSENAAYDNGMLAEVLQQLENNEYDISVTGFSPEEINAYLNTEALDEILGLEIDEPTESIDFDEDLIEEVEEINTKEKQLKRFSVLLTEEQEVIVKNALLEKKEQVGRASNGELLVMCLA